MAYTGLEILDIVSYEYRLPFFSEDIIDTFVEMSGCDKREVEMDELE